jgi:hypothetical protein
VTQEFLRKVSLVVATSGGNGLEFSDFKITFTVKRGDMQTPNSLDARIFNLKPDTANRIAKKEFTTISLSAGYHGNVGLLFQGSIVQFRQGRINQTDSYVDITAADSDRAYNYATVSASPKAGTRRGSVADIIQGAMNAKADSSQAVTQGYRPKFQGNGSIRGQALYGMARDVCRDFALANGCKWSLQDGALTFIPWTSFIPGGPVPVISVGTGLIQVPEQTQAGINIRTLLNPSYKVGSLVRLDSQINRFRFNLDYPSSKTNPALLLQSQIAPNIGPNTGNPSDQQGLYYVMVANHTGDTRGTNWYTDLICLSADATLVNKDQSNALLQTGPVPIFRFGGT